MGTDASVSWIEQNSEGCWIVLEFASASGSIQRLLEIAGFLFLSQLLV